MEKRNIPIDKELHRQFKMYCAKHELLMAKVIEKLIELEIKKGAETPNYQIKPNE